MKAKRNKPLFWLARAGDSYIGKNHGNNIVTFTTPPWPWQLKEFRRMGEKTIEKLQAQYGKEIKAVAVYDGDIVSSEFDRISVYRPDSSPSFL